MIGVSSKPTRRGLTWEKICVGCMDVGGDCTCQFSIPRNNSNDLLMMINFYWILKVMGFSKKVDKKMQIWWNFDYIPALYWEGGDILHNLVTFCQFYAYLINSMMGGLLKLFYGQWERELPLI